MSPRPAAHRGLQGGRLQPILVERQLRVARVFEALSRDPQGRRGTHVVAATFPAQRARAQAQPRGRLAHERPAPVPGAPEG